MWRRTWLLKYSFESATLSRTKFSIDAPGRKSCLWIEKKDIIYLCFDFTEFGKELLRKDGSDQGLLNLKFTASLDVQEGYFPWHAAIYNNDIFICSGALVSETKVVTAANCFNFLDKTPSNFRVVLEDNDRSKDEG